MRSAGRSPWWPGWPKRAFDLAAASLALILLAPLLALTALAIALFLGRPVIFRQRRPGRHGRPFVLYKFRTMSVARGADGALLPDRDRLTRLGRLLRRTSLDELPELINVIRGDMSLVGPRPLLMEYLSRYTPEQARRHEVRPGITGWAQLNGRNRLPWEHRFALDVWYVDHQSLRRISGSCSGRRGSPSPRPGSVSPGRGRRRISTGARRRATERRPRPRASSP
jgi:lipopolysaccharide/colanic/teichoic acid biosynthesis glycosyltransferase